MNEHSTYEGEVEFDEPELVVTQVMHHVQVRVFEKGPRKGDGKVGRILLEDDNAPIEVVRWLKSSKCKKALGNKKAVIYINNELIENTNQEDPNTDKDENDINSNSLEIANMHPVDPIKFAQALETIGYAKRLAVQLVEMEKEVNNYKEKMKKEIEYFDEQIQNSRDRLKSQLELEDEENQRAAERRRSLSSERQQMTEDLAMDRETFNEARQNMKTWNNKNSIETITETVKNISENPLGQALTAFLLKKAGIEIPTS